MTRFTLVELMIVVAIISILAAVAIPNFVAMQLRAKRGEAPLVLDGMSTAWVAADAGTVEFDSFSPAALQVVPAGLTKQKQHFAVFDAYASGGVLAISEVYQADAASLYGAYFGNRTGFGSATSCSASCTPASGGFCLQGLLDVDDDDVVEAMYVSSTMGPTWAQGAGCDNI